MYELDNQNKFVKGKPTLVSGNTAAMLGEGGLSWLSSHFEVRHLPAGARGTNPLSITSHAECLLCFRFTVTDLFIMA